MKDYVALGHIVTPSPAYPKQGDIYCVRRYFVELGNLNTEKTGQDGWQPVWTTSKFRANSNVRLFQQKKSANIEHIFPESFQAVKETSGRDTWSDPQAAYYLKKLNVDFYTNTPVAEQWIEEDSVKFFLNDTTETFEHGAKVGRTVIKNWSHVQQRATRSISYSLDYSVEGNTGDTMELGLSLEGKIGGKGNCLSNFVIHGCIIHKKP